MDADDALMFEPERCSSMREPPFMARSTGMMRSRLSLRCVSCTMLRVCGAGDAGCRDALFPLPEAAFDDDDSADRS